MASSGRSEMVGWCNARSAGMKLEVVTYREPLSMAGESRDELGRMLMTYDGRQFKLEIRDKGEGF